MRDGNLGPLELSMTRMHKSSCLLTLLDEFLHIQQKDSITDE
jgi:hypothetical protein